MYQVTRNVSFSKKFVRSTWMVSINVIFNNHGGQVDSGVKLDQRQVK